ncbi:MAG: PspC domain-containing protein, partial [Eubacterium sp.]
KKKNYLCKDKQSGIITGVCQGLGSFFHISPWIIRAIFVIPVLPVPFSFLSGVISVGVYILLSVVLKDKKTIKEDDNVVEVEYEIIDDEKDDNENKDPE